MFVRLRRAEGELRQLLRTYNVLWGSAHLGHPRLRLKFLIKFLTFPYHEGDWFCGSILPFWRCDLAAAKALKQKLVSAVLTGLAEFMFLQLRKLALQHSPWELFRSHPKDERGSVREIGLWIRIAPTLHFLELSLTLWWELPRSSEWSFSGPFWLPESHRK